jgi:hypothetical protein
MAPVDKPLEVLDAFEAATLTLGAAELLRAELDACRVIVRTVVVELGTAAVEIVDEEVVEDDEEREEEDDEEDEDEDDEEVTRADD